MEGIHKMVVDIFLLHLGYSQVTWGQDINTEKILKYCQLVKV